MDRVQVLKQESTALGGDDADMGEWGPSPIDPQEDAIEAAGLYLQSALDRDTAVLISRDASGNIVFKDEANTGGRSLTQLVTGTSAFDKLEKDERNGFKKLIYTTGIVTSIEVYADGALTNLLYTKTLTYTLGLLTQLSILRASDSLVFGKNYTYLTGFLTEVHLF